jgi:hypothetical protein
MVKKRARSGKKGIVVSEGSSPDDKRTGRQ